jgi:predicted nucleic acid-binding protein
MADYYADSSVLVKRHVNEKGSIWFRTLAEINSGNTMITARISVIEVHSAFCRRRREANLSALDLAQITTDFARICAIEYEFIELTSAVVDRAKQILERYTLRAYDAVQVSSALLANEGLTRSGMPSLIFLASDQNLLATAVREGLSTDDPNLYT